MILCLTGMMGCGKSSTGRVLAGRLGIPFADLDHLIETRTGRSIPEIFKTDGEPVFRSLEHETLAAFLSGTSTDCVLALGGGTVMTPACAELVRQQTCCIYLRADADTLCRRLSAHGQAGRRPLLSPASGQSLPPTCADGTGADDALGKLSALRQRIEKLLAEREPVYSAAACHTVDTDTLSPAAVADEICRLLRNQNSSFLPSSFS